MRPWFAQARDVALESAVVAEQREKAVVAKFEQATAVLTAIGRVARPRAGAPAAVQQLSASTFGADDVLLHLCPRRSKTIYPPNHCCHQLG